MSSLLPMLGGLGGNGKPSIDELEEQMEKGEQQN